MEGYLFPNKRRFLSRNFSFPPRAEYPIYNQQWQVRRSKEVWIILHSGIFAWYNIKRLETRECSKYAEFSFVFRCFILCFTEKLRILMIISKKSWRIRRKRNKALAISIFLKSLKVIDKEGAYGRYINLVLNVLNVVHFFLQKQHPKVLHTKSAMDQTSVHKNIYVV